MTNRNKWLLGIGSLLAIVAAAFIVRKSRSDGEEKPPKGAPQLDIDNPGSQHDFPNAPTQSDLG